MAAHARLAPFGISFLKMGNFRSTPTTIPSRSPTPPASNATKPNKPYKYDVAISFAGPERPLAEEVAKNLRSATLEVFYDNFYPEQLWGKDLAAEFDRIYRKESRFCLMFVSAEYARRIWTTHERRSALSRMVQENGKEYILPVRVDDTDLDGLPPTIGYISIANYSTEAIGKLLIAKLKT